MGTNTFDVALAYDPVNHRCDVVFNGQDFAIDRTPASAMLFSILADRRARPDDVLPTPVPDWSNPSSLTARRGWPGDALDPNGQLTGSRVWLYIRAKETVATRLGVQSAIAEATQWLTTQRGLALQLIVRWIRRGVLGYQLSAGRTTVQINGPGA
jgi:phage gp46-like protein